MNIFRRIVLIVVGWFRPEPAVPPAAPVVESPPLIELPPAEPAIREPPAAAESSDESNKIDRKTANKIADAAHDVLQALEQMTINGLDLKENLLKETETSLGDLWGCDFHFVSELANSLSGSENRWFQGDEEKSSELNEVVLPIDIAGVWRQSDGHFVFTRAQSISPASVRGKVTMSPRHIIKVTTAVLYPKTNRWWAAQELLGYVGREWVSIEPVFRNARATTSGTVDAVRDTSIEYRR